MLGKMAETDSVNFGLLQTELEKSKDKLKNVEDNIKKLTGRDPNEFIRPGIRPFRQLDNARGRFSSFGRGSRVHEGDGFNNRPGGFPRFQQVGSFGEDRLGRLKRRDRESDEDEPASKHGLQSSVVAKGAVTREQVLEKQKSDSSGVARNRRMFGVLLGTLQKFSAEEKRKLDAEAKRKEIEKKLEEKAKQEKDAVIKEKQELRQQHRQARIKIRQLEQKMELAEIHSEWEKQTMHLMNFIRTQAKPHIFYLPKKHNSVSEKKLSDSHKLLEAIIGERRKQLNEEIAELMNEDATKDAGVTAAKKQGGESEEDEDSDGDLDEGHVAELIHEDVSQTGMDTNDNAAPAEKEVANSSNSATETNGNEQAIVTEDSTPHDDKPSEQQNTSDEKHGTNHVKDHKTNVHSSNESDSNSSDSTDSESDSDRDEVMLTSEKMDVE